MRNRNIPYYENINDFLAAIPIENRSANPHFYCMRLEEQLGDIYMPPFKRGFYFMALLQTFGNTHVSFNESQDNVIKESFLVFQSPGLLYSFHRDRNTKGILLYFKLESFNFFKPDFHTEFPFFDMLNTNLFQLTHDQYNELNPQMEQIYQVYQNEEYGYQMALHIFLALLYKLKAYIKTQKYALNSSPDQQLLRLFISLINTHYIEEKTVAGYAKKLAISTGHLSKSVRIASGENARSFINSRVIKEAKSLILYTHLSMAEIGYKLGFLDHSHFGKFFRKHTGTSPLEYKRNSKTQELTNNGSV